MVKYWEAKGEGKRGAAPVEERKSYSGLVSTILSLALIAGLVYLGFYLNKRFSEVVSKKREITIAEKEVSRRGLTKKTPASTYHTTTPIASQTTTTPSKITEKKKLSKVPAQMVYIPAGEFIIGWDKEDRAVKISTESFCIDRYEVTNEDYKKFIESTGYRPPKHPVESKYNIWEGDNYPSALARHPVVNVSWGDAAAYARWSGKRLPAEIEWEKAARGTDGRLYPWGNKFERSNCNSSESKRKGTSPVGSYFYGDSPYGCFDMAGNVWEWTSTLYDSKHKWHLACGGSWAEGKNRIDVTARSNPITASPTVGFRCVKDAK